jgi:hypothetical protein
MKERPEGPGIVPRAGLCESCIHSVKIRSDRGSVYYRCQRALSDSSYEKYPRLPVLACRGYEEAAEA